MRIRTFFNSLTLIALGLNAPAMASDSLIDDLPMPEVVASLTQNVCVFAAKTGQPVSALLPASARPFAEEDLAGRL